MSDPTDDNDDLDLEFDEIFSDLGRESDAERGTPEEERKAPTAAPATPPPSRGLYRPSTPPPPEERVTAVPRTPLPPAFDRVTVPTPSSALPPPPAPVGAAAPPFDPMTSWDDDEPNEATRVVELPVEMLAALGRKRQTERPTAPPPAHDDAAADRVDVAGAPSDGDAARAPAIEADAGASRSGEEHWTDDDAQDDDDDDDDEPVLEFEPLTSHDDGAPDALSELLGDLMTDAPATSASADPTARSGDDALWDAPPPYEGARGGSSPAVPVPENDSLDATPDHGFDAWADDVPSTAREDGPELDFGPSDTAPPPASPAPAAPGGDEDLWPGTEADAPAEALAESSTPAIRDAIEAAGPSAGPGDGSPAEGARTELAFDAPRAAQHDDDDDEPELEFDA
ncbi:MAG: hypothetical protein KC668_26055, partial [Myxococcales bacterium]|nr:hypothetical protein [Myxococcales bacterium]